MADLGLPDLSSLLCKTGVVFKIHRCLAEFLVFVRDRSLRSEYHPVVFGHEINLAQDIETVGVTSVTGFRHREFVTL